MASWDNKESMVYKSQSLDDLTMLGRKDSIGLGEYKNMIRGALSEENLIEKRTSFFAQNELVEKKRATTRRDADLKRRRKMANLKMGENSGGNEDEADMESTLEKFRLTLSRKSTKGRGGEFKEDFENDFCDIYQHKDLGTAKFEIKQSESKTHIANIRNSEILRKENYNEMRKEKKNKRVRFSKDIGGEINTKCEQPFFFFFLFS